jgi:hypothetical protein
MCRVRILAVSATVDNAVQNARRRAHNVHGCIATS